MGKSISEGINEISPEGFVTFGNGITPLCGFLLKDISLFLYPIIYFVSIKKSKKVDAPFIWVLYMGVVFIVHLE
jgi:hypothetical protein